jgi:hypothetical protein
MGMLAWFRPSFLAAVIRGATLAATNVARDLQADTKGSFFRDPATKAAASALFDHCLFPMSGTAL